MWWTVASTTSIRTSARRGDRDGRSGSAVVDRLARRFDDVELVDSLAVGLTRSGVATEVVERPAVVGDLLSPVVGPLSRAQHRGGGTRARRRWPGECRPHLQAPAGVLARALVVGLE